MSQKDQSEAELDSIASSIEEDIDDGKEPHILPGPIKIILGLFIILIIVLWVLPYYAIKTNPEPKHIPSISEVYSLNSSDNYSVNLSANISAQSNYINRYILAVDSRNPDVKSVADRISSIACDYSENYIVCQSKAVFYFVRDNFDYVRDPTGYEYIKGPIESLNNLGGDCDDASVLLSSLLGSIGIHTRLVFVPNHVYVEAYIPEAISSYKAYSKQNWVALDATCKNCDFGSVPLSTTKAAKDYYDVT